MARHAHHIQHPAPPLQQRAQADGAATQQPPGLVRLRHVSHLHPHITPLPHHTHSVPNMFTRWFTTSLEGEDLPPNSHLAAVEAATGEFCISHVEENREVFEVGSQALPDHLSPRLCSCWSSGCLPAGLHGCRAACHPGRQLMLAELARSLLVSSLPPMPCALQLGVEDRDCDITKDYGELLKLLV